jgi:hypothetical protein
MSKHSAKDDTDLCLQEYLVESKTKTNILASNSNFQCTIFTPAKSYVPIFQHVRVMRDNKGETTTTQIPFILVHAFRTCLHAHICERERD